MRYKKDYRKVEKVEIKPVRFTIYLDNKYWGDLDWNEHQGYWYFCPINRALRPMHFQTDNIDEVIKELNASLKQAKIC